MKKYGILQPTNRTPPESPMKGGLKERTMNPAATTVPPWTLPGYAGQAQIRWDYTAADPPRPSTEAERTVRGRQHDL